MPESASATAESSSDTPNGTLRPDDLTADAAAPSAPAPASPLPTDGPSLDDPYLYHNSRTAAPSTAPLALRQLCRILCPPRGAPKAGVVTPDTLVIGYDPATGTYSERGWTKARDLPVLGEACAAWHYESGGEGGTKGPVTARELSAMLNDADAEEAIDGLTRVWSADLGQQRGWKSLSDLPHLRMALEALAPEAEPSWARAPSGEAENRGTKEEATSEGAGGRSQQQGDWSQHQQTFDPSPVSGGGSSGGGTGSQEGSVIVSTASTIGEGSEILSHNAADELEAFLTSTTASGSGGRNDGDGGGSDEDEEYESDEGTKYVRDHRTGEWIPEHLAPPRKPKKKDADDQMETSTDRTVKASNQAGKAAGVGETNGTNNKRKRKKDRGNKFKARNARCWVYVTGLPPDTDEIEVSKYFGRVGVIDLDPETQHPKVKLYRHKRGGGGVHGTRGAIKGDASICYVRPESVDLAIQLLDESHFRADGSAQLRVQRAKFEQHGESYEDGPGRRNVSAVQRKVARLAALQAVTWDESGEGGRITGGRKGLRIIVLKGMFAPEELGGKAEDKKIHAIEEEVHRECGQWGTVEKITIFSKNRDGVVVIKFSQPTAASQAVEGYHGRVRDGRKIDASYWDGVTDYTVREEEKERKEESKRLDEFGKWLENQELPEELRLNVEGQ